MSFYATIHQQSVCISKDPTKDSLSVSDEDALAFFEGRAKLDDYEVKNRSLVRKASGCELTHFKLYTGTLDADGKMELPTHLQHRTLYVIDQDDLTKIIDTVEVSVFVDFSTLPANTKKVINGYELIAHPRA